ncbi:hypothetical protein [uncultured Tateyamaria sp.]|uniref:DUF7678 domain-containing protein n=1 Tax=uncultured Tateyamaria sp. TaxID=455651 RepID=UPI00261A8CBF|nr:hypothetical protein [uncultured Tateyamaria sp.]
MSDDKTPTSKDAFGRITNPDGTPVRDKDNAAPDLKPTQTQRPAPNLAPPGMSGIKQPIAQRQVSPHQEKIIFRKDPSSLVPRANKQEAGLSIDGGKVEPDLWIKGTLITMPGYSFAAKMYDAPSEHGLEGGQVSKLEVRKNGEVIVNYDRGWDVEPKTGEHVEAVLRIREGLGDTRENEIKTPEQKPEKDHGMSR